MKILTNSLLDMVRFAHHTNNIEAGEIAASILSYIVHYSLLEHETVIPKPLHQTYLDLVTVVQAPHLYPDNIPKDPESQLPPAVQSLIDELNNIEGFKEGGGTIEIFLDQGFDPEDPKGPTLA